MFTYMYISHRKCYIHSQAQIYTIQFHSVKYVDAFTSLRTIIENCCFHGKDCKFCTLTSIDGGR